MKSLVEQMQSYASYHRDTRNKISHFFGVPLVVYSLFIPLGWFRWVHGPAPISAATLFYAGVFIYYCRLDYRIALLQMPISVGLLYLADQASTLPIKDSLAFFAASFVGGWIIQLLGHVFEGKRPALADNITQIFNAPLFLMVEFLIFLGFRKDLKAQIG